MGWGVRASARRVIPLPQAGLTPYRQFCTDIALCRVHRNANAQTAPHASLLLESASMCGRYVSRADAALERAWHLSRPPPLFWSFNVAPGTNVPVVRLHDGQRHPQLMRWGLIPFWAKGKPPKYSTINARAEGVKTAASYRGPWKRGQRCLFVVNGFYEWQVVPGQRVKQPWYAKLREQETFALGGLWDTSVAEDGERVESATIVTLPANELMCQIHNDKKRMPLVLDVPSFDAWLNPDPRNAEAEIRPYPSADMEAWPVSTFMNKPANDDETCIAPVGDPPPIEL